MIAFGKDELVESIAADARCSHCDEPFDQHGGVINGANGPPMAWHRECLLRTLVGGFNHLRKCCTCCGGDSPPDPRGLSRRQAAILAAVYYKVQVAQSS